MAARSWILAPSRQVEVAIMEKGRQATYFIRRGAWGIALLGIVALLSTVSCNSGPRAPAITTEAIFNNPREGFSFLVPEGWVQQSRSDIPPGSYEKARLLVSYQ